MQKLSRMRLISVLVMVPLVVAFLVVPANGSHSQTQPNGDTMSFTQVGGNEWWVQVRLAGPDGPSAWAVQAQDTGGPWVDLAAQSWTQDRSWWAGSFRIEPGNQVRFRASFPDGVMGFESCWFDHPSGVERCATDPTPTTSTPTSTGASKEAESFVTRTAGGRQGLSGASGGAVWNLWSNGHVQDSIQGDGSATLSVIASGTPLGGTWPTMVVSIDGVIARTTTVSSRTLTEYPIVVLSPGPHTIRIAFPNDAASSAEDRNLVLDVARTGAGTSPTPTTTTTTPPPPPNAKEAESFAVRTAGGRQAQASASGGAVWNLWSNGHIQDSIQSDGAAALVIVARGQSLGGVWPTMVVSVDGVAATTVTVASGTLTEYPIGVLPAGPHSLRIAFTNDASSSTEDRNLILDVARGGAGGVGTGGGPWTLAADQTAHFFFDWAGGPGHFMADAATPSDLNLRQRLRVTIDFTTPREERVAGPIARPAWVAFDLPPGRHGVVLTALGGTVLVSDAGVSTAAPTTNFTGLAARTHSGGNADGAGWRFTDFGYLESRLVVPTTGWYQLRVQGAGTINDVGPLVHLWLNRTVVAEGTQSTNIDLSSRRLLHAGVGYTLGASFENPWPGRTARFDTLSAVPSLGPAALPPALAVQANDDPDGWPQYGRDGYNTRSVLDAALPSATSAADLRLKWRTVLDGSVTGTPIVMDGRVYVGTWGNSFYCLNAITGAILWRTGLPNNIDASAALANGLVVVSNGNTMVALDALSGVQRWSATFGGHSWSSPTIDDGAVFVGLGVGRGYVARLDLLTGSTVWITPTTEIENGGARVWASPLVAPGSGLVVVGTSPGTVNGEGPTIDSLLAYDRETGALRWVHQFFPRDRNLESTHEETLLTNRDISGTPHLTFLDGRPVVLASQKHGPAWIVDLTDGSLVSGGRLIEQRAALIGSGGVADGIRVVSASDPDRVAAFDVATGDLLWQHPMPSTEFAPVAIANGVVWIGNWGGSLHAFDLRTGREIVQLNAGGGVLGGASFADGRVFVGAMEKPASGAFADSLGRLPGSVSAWGAP